MRAFDAYGGRRPLVDLVYAATLVILATLTLGQPALAAEPVSSESPTLNSAAGTTTAGAGEPVILRMDQAKVLKLPEKTATLVVGNPLIADASAQPGGIMVLTPKSAGTTNIVALDSKGVTLMEHPVHVVGAVDHVVVLYRGIDRESYSCAPTCERRIAIGDAQNSFAAILTQSATLNSQAQAASR